jgi:cation transporter-like permease
MLPVNNVFIFLSDVKIKFNKIPVLLAFRSVQLCIFKARLTTFEKLKDIKHEYENSRKLTRKTQKDVIVSVKMYMLFS